MDYLDELNDEQRKAVEALDGPVMVLAGAGSGKTRVLTYRIAHLINKGVPPFNILALTFTNKAAREMKERIARITGETNAKSIWMGTFHSIFARILRIEAEKIGYPSNFTIYDSEDSKRLIKDIVKGLNLDDKVYKPKLVLNRISSAKNNLLSPAAYQDNAIIAKEDAQSKKPLLGKLYEVYNTRLFKAGAMDFDDLLFKMNILLRDFPQVLYKYQEKFRYIMVDEYQDTNFSQYIIVKALGSRFENVCVVGDDAQSIYSFRGANIQNILNFQKDYPDTQMFKLEQNYRSTQNIVDAANSLINKNKEQFQKNVWTSNTAGNKIKLIQTLSDNEEGLQVAHQIYSTHSNENTPYSSFAILYRTNAQSRALEDSMRKLNLPYRIYGGLSFYQRKEVKDLLAYFRLVMNPKDEDALKRVINYPKRGIGKTTIDKLSLYSNEQDIPLWDIISRIDEFPLNIAGATKNKIKQFTELIKSFITVATKKDAFEAGTIIAKSTEILRVLNKDKSIEGISRYENVQELLNSMKDFVEDDQQDVEDKTLATFIQDVPLLTDKDEKEDDEGDKVTLMTIHASKGLEFPYVFVVGLEENLFPSQMAVNSKSDLEEERRLFYVALTRAEQQCCLSFARSRYKYGDLLSCEPSRFITEIDPAFIDASGAAEKKPEKDPFETSWEPQGSMPSGFTNNSPAAGKTQNKFTRVPPSAPESDFQGDDTSALTEGAEVEHKRFGKGVVLSVENSGNRSAVIEFDDHGVKKLLLKFAKLKIY